jgi:hypothetical protein
MEPFLLPRHPDAGIVPTRRRSSASRPATSTGAPVAASSSTSVSAPSVRRVKPDLDPEDDPPTTTDDQTAAIDEQADPVDPDLPISGKQGKRWREDDDEAENCIICLGPVVDRTVMVSSTAPPTRPRPIFTSDDSC